jgi:hypothetical protein
MLRRNPQSQNSDYELGVGHGGFALEMLGTCGSPSGRQTAGLGATLPCAVGEGLECPGRT